MNFLIPLLASILQSTSSTLDKVILSIKGISFKTYTQVSFPLLFLIDLVLFFIVRPPFSLQLFMGGIGLAVLGSVTISIITNLMYYRALKYDHLSELQVISLVNTVPLILITSILFKDERNLLVIACALIASAVMIWAHWEKGHFKMRKHTWPFALWILIAMPASAALSKMLVHAMHPIILEMVRDAIIALILIPLFRGASNHIPKRGLWLLLATNILSACAWVLFYLSYQRVGIIYTLLIFSIEPMLVYFASVVILREPFHKKKFAAFVAILIAIGLAQVLK